MLREECNIVIGLRISERMDDQLKIYMENKGITTRAGAVRCLITEKLEESVGRMD